MEKDVQSKAESNAPVFYDGQGDDAVYDNKEEHLARIGIVTGVVCFFLMLFLLPFARLLLASNLDRTAGELVAFLNEDLSEQGFSVEAPQSLRFAQHESGEGYWTSLPMTCREEAGTEYELLVFTDAPRADGNILAVRINERAEKGQETRLVPVCDSIMRFLTPKRAMLRTESNRKDTLRFLRSDLQSRTYRFSGYFYRIGQGQLGHQTSMVGYLAGVIVTDQTVSRYVHFECGTLRNMRFFSE